MSEKGKKVIFYCCHPDRMWRNRFFGTLASLPFITEQCYTTIKTELIYAYTDSGTADVKPKPIWKEVNHIKEVIPEIKQIQPDLMICVYVHEIIPKEILDICPVIGFHPQDIELRRGNAPISHNIRNGIELDYVTMFYYTEEIDYGKIIGQQPYLIEANETSGDIVEKLMGIYSDMLEMYVPVLLKNGDIGKMPQKKGVYGWKLNEDDNEIRLDEMNSEQISRIIRACDIYGGAWIRLKDGKKLKIFKGSWKIED